METFSEIENRLNEEKVEKSKKNKRFIKFLAKYIQTDKTLESDESSQQPKHSLLEILKQFTQKEASKETKNEDIIIENQETELEHITEYVDSTLQNNIDSLQSGKLDQNETNQVYIETMVLSKLKDRIDNGVDIDVDEIVYETAHEIEELEELETARMNNLNKKTEIEDKSSEGEPDTESRDEPAPLSKPIPSILKSKTEPKPTEKLPETVNTVSDRLTQSNYGTSPTSSTPASANFVNRNLSSSPTFNKITSSSNMQRLPKFQEVYPIQGHNRKDPVNPEHLIVNSPSFKKLKSIEYASPNVSQNRTVETYNQPIIERSLSDAEYLRQAEKIYLDKVSLRRIYEKSDLSINDLRRLLSGESKKKGLRKDVKRALGKRNNSYSDIVSSIKNRRFRPIPGITKTKVKSKPIKSPEAKRRTTPPMSSSPQKSDVKDDNTIHRPILTIAIIVIAILAVVLFIIFT